MAGLADLTAGLHQRSAQKSTHRPKTEARISEGVSDAGERDLPQEIGGCKDHEAVEVVGV